MIPIKSIMTNHVISIKEDTQIYKAIDALVNNNISGLPVLSDDGSLLGIVTEKDIMTYMLTADVKDMTKPVAEIMVRDVVSFNEDDDVAKVFKCLMENAFRRAPILSEGKVVGIVSRRNIIKHSLMLLSKGINF
ncbi:MAG: HPP family protein [bacterium]